MASIPIVSHMERKSVAEECPIRALAAQWAQKLRTALCQAAPYMDAEPTFVLPASVTLDESIMEAPRRRSADDNVAALANEVAQLLYPSPDNSLGPLIKYEKDITKLRRYVLQQRKRKIEDATQRHELLNWGKRIMNQGPWDPVEDPLPLNGAPSLPMPVTIAEPDTMAPFFDHLRSGGTEHISSSKRAIEDAIEVEEPYYGVKTLEFEKGVVYSDRRMDLCKMSLGPTNIHNLLESLKTNEFVTHFLLGNNIIGPHGAKCIAEFVKEYPDRMDTWYLAGNCIDSESFHLLVEQWVRSTSVTNIWLKRNPLKATAAHDLYRLITETPNLRTLDLDQTELGDGGVAELFSKLSQHNEKVSLRHIYLNAVGIGLKGATAIRNFLASPHCALESLYAANNPLGSAGVEAMAVSLIKNKSLKRLALASVGMDDDGATTLCEALRDHPGLITLDLGQSYATPDLDSRYNWITDSSVHAIHNLVKSSPKLAYLNVGYCAITNSGLNEILGAVQTSPTLLYYSAKTIWPQSKAATEVLAGQKHVALSKLANDQLLANVRRVHGQDVDYQTFLGEHKRFLVNEKSDVRKIDSVYRNRDAGLARRGLKQLDKWWDEDDETLEEVMKAVGPVCTRKKTKNVALRH